jgi:hypothetical protein
MADASSLNTLQAPDIEATLAALFDRAKTVTETRSLQDYTRLALDGAAHLYAHGIATGDTRLAGAALRELRHLLAFHAHARVEVLRTHPGWRAEPQPMDPVHDMLQVFMASLEGDNVREQEARKRLGWDELPLESELEPAP